MSHDEVVEMVELYALHSLDAAEERMVEAHLDRCGECEARLAVALTATASLVEDTEAPNHVWHRIIAQIDTGHSTFGFSR